MNYTWINKAVYTNILDVIANFSNYYAGMVGYLAAICFLMSLGMSCFKIFLQAADARQEFIKLFVNFVIYSIMIWLYPTVMKAAMPFATSMGYGAVFGASGIETDVDVDDDTNQKTVAGFYEYMDKWTCGIFTTTTVTDEKGASKIALNFNIVDAKSGRIDLNKTFKFAIAMMSVMWHSFPKFSLLAGDNSLGLVFLYLGTMIVALICYLMCLINYVTALVDYYALQGFGILMVPLSLWEGTKSYTSTLIGGIGKMIVKMMVISAMLFLSVMSVVNIFVEVYVADGFVAKYIEMCVVVIFQSILLYMITKQTSSIAGFLSGGDPKLSFGEFAQAAAQTAATAGAAKGGTAAIGNAANGFKSGGKAAVASGLVAAAMGGPAGAVAKSVLSSAGKSALTSAAGNLAGMPGALKAAPGRMMGSLNSLTGAGMGMSAEGVGNMPLSDEQVGGGGAGGGMPVGGSPAESAAGGGGAGGNGLNNAAASANGGNAKAQGLSGVHGTADGKNAVESGKSTGSFASNMSALGSAVKSGNKEAIKAAADRTMQYANLASQSDNSFTRKGAAIAGFAANMAQGKSFSESMARSGPSGISSVMNYASAHKAAKAQGMSGKEAFAKGVYSAVSNGTTAAEINRGGGIEAYTDNAHGHVTANGFNENGNAGIDYEQVSGVSDYDAVNMAQEATENAEKSNGENE